MLILFTDTDTDITPEIAEKYGYKIISMPYSVDGTTVYPFVDYDKFDSRKFYDMLRDGALPTTSAISEEQYIKYFEPVFADGDDILYVHFSRNMTATFDAMDKAVAVLCEKYPERRFYEIDTKGISALSLLIVEEVGEQYKTGKSVDEILAWAKEEVDHYAIYFLADDLKFFKHSGRVSNLAGTMGTLLGIRPIIHINEEGKMISIGKEKGRAKAIDRIVSYVEELGDDVKNHRIVIGNTDAPELLDDVKAALRKKFGDDLVIEECVTNPTIGSHCGPDSVGVAFHAIHR